MNEILVAQCVFCIEQTFQPLTCSFFLAGVRTQHHNWSSRNTKFTSKQTHSQPDIFLRIAWFSCPVLHWRGQSAGQAVLGKLFKYDGENFCTKPITTWTLITGWSSQMSGIWNSQTLNYKLHPLPLYDCTLCKYVLYIFFFPRKEKNFYYYLF